MVSVEKIEDRDHKVEVMAAMAVSRHYRTFSAIYGNKVSTNPPPHGISLVNYD